MESSGQKKLLLVNGPNLNLLGTRERHIYESTTLPQITSALSDQAQVDSIELKDFQSNHEVVIIERIHLALEAKLSGIIINPGAFTHTSVAIRDALVGVQIPFIEIHSSNVHAREPFRHHSYLSDRAEAVICGLGTNSYVAALD
ncbi:Catabolic 3-dehydroquinase [Endocarpon pusillum Z07020]|uniref:Catabolic 3-dehydroquinase n=2 Tax=Endocarpon pusillum TaxID=364733 RepID=U1HJ64_ENDPU|nr:Catabolic 3-dehydroquinase [Endocarpon pusillum Z07020]AEH41466.1 3-dehydroquinate dehydratase type II [Endocarpon pusillum]ERF70245.1 Catabolic 3-dehydroquinase [Endocarpon pusillum Z07020]